MFFVVVVVVIDVVDISTVWCLPVLTNLDRLALEAAHQSPRHTNRAAVERGCGGTARRHSAANGIDVYTEAFLEHMERVW